MGILLNGCLTRINGNFSDQNLLPGEPEVIPFGSHSAISEVRWLPFGNQPIPARVDCDRNTLPGRVQFFHGKPSQLGFILQSYLNDIWSMLPGSVINTLVRRNEDQNPLSGDFRSIRRFPTCDGSNIS